MALTRIPWLMVSRTNIRISWIKAPNDQMVTQQQKMPGRGLANTVAGACQQRYWFNPN
jgi:hypothetical protein